MHRIRFDFVARQIQVCDDWPSLQQTHELLQLLRSHRDRTLLLDTITVARNVDSSKVDDVTRILAEQDDLQALVIRQRMEIYVGRHVAGSRRERESGAKERDRERDNVFQPRDNAQSLSAGGCARERSGAFVVSGRHEGARGVGNIQVFYYGGRGDFRTVRRCHTRACDGRLLPLHLMAGDHGHDSMRPGLRAVVPE